MFTEQAQIAVLGERITGPAWLLFMALILPGNNSYASHLQGHEQNPAYSNGKLTSEKGIEYELLNEAYDTGWALYIDNDVIISGGKTDQDYTGGLSLTLSGSRATEYLISIDSWRESLTRWSSLDSLYNDKQHFNLHSFSFGMTLFTPANLSASEPILNDHPYASYFYISNSNEIVVPENDIVYQSILSIGFLGLGIAEDIQKSLHNTLDAEEPMGWDNQISSGGELAAKYTLAAQKMISLGYARQYTRHEFKVTGEANLGFATNASLGFNWRWGRITTPWWSFNPHLSDYINMGVPIVNEIGKTHAPELFIWVGGNVSYRIYNAILQGQFKESAVTFDDDEIERVGYEVSAGIACEFYDGIRVSIFGRKRSAALKQSDARAPQWGGITISKSY